MENRRSMSLCDIRIYLKNKNTEKGSDIPVILRSASTGILHPFTLKECCWIVSRQLKELQQKNSQLRNLCSEQAKEMKETRTWLTKTKRRLAETEQLRRIKIEQSNQIQTSIGNIERCLNAERVDRLIMEKILGKSKIEERKLNVAILDESLLREDMKVRFEFLEDQLKCVEGNVDAEKRRQTELKEETKNFRNDQAQIECDIKCLNCQLKMENTLLKAEENAQDKLCFQNKTREELLEKKLLQEKDLQRKIDEKKGQIKDVLDENDALTSYMQELKKTKMGRFPRFMAWFRRLNCFGDHVNDLMNSST